MELDSYEQWEQHLKYMETSAIKLVQNTFKTSPLGCVAISLSMPKNIKRDWKKE